MHDGYSAIISLLFVVSSDQNTPTAMLRRFNSDRNSEDSPCKVGYHQRQSRYSCHALFQSSRGNMSSQHFSHARKASHITKANGSPNGYFPRMALAPEAVEERVTVRLDFRRGKVEVFSHKAHEQRRRSIVGKLAGLKPECREHGLKQLQTHSSPPLLRDTEEVQNAVHLQVCHFPMRVVEIERFSTEFQESNGDVVMVVHEKGMVLGGENFLE